MAKDVSLFFHGTGSSGTTMASSTGTNHPTVDLGSNTINRTLLVRMYMGAAKSGTGNLDVTFQDSTDNTTFVNMPGATGALLGFARQLTHSYSSTDAVAADAPARVVIRTDKRYVRAVSTVSATTTSWGGVTVVADVIDGGFAFAAGPRDT